MDTCETIFVQLDVVQSDIVPGDIVRWLHGCARQLAAPHWGKVWAIGPRSYADAPPVVFETVALYALPVGRSLSEGEPALALSFLPLYQCRLVLELRRWPLLSVALETVVRCLASDFPKHNVIVSDAAPPQPGVGAPPLICNSWLETQLLDSPSRADLRLLYPQWLEQYRAVRGYYPAEPYRSFRAAVSGCRKRIRRARKQLQ